MQVTAQNATYQSDPYIMNPSNKVIEMRKEKGVRLDQPIILKYQDNTEWVYLNNKSKERFCGFLYLQKALKESNLNTIQAAENKIAIHDRKIIYLSRWCGDIKLDFMELDVFKQEFSTLKNVGFIDINGSANIRKQDDVLYVFDTEKTSFDSNVHEEIDSFIQQHDRIRSDLEKLLMS